MSSRLYPDTQNNPKIDFVSFHPNQSNKNKFHNNLTVASTGKYWLVTCSQSVRFFWPFFSSPTAWTMSLTLFGEEWKAVMSKRTDFNALKISLHLSQNNRSMPGLLSYSWDNVSAWKACDICNGETSESVKHTSYGFEEKKERKKERRKYVEANSEQYWSNSWDCDDSVFTQIHLLFVIQLLSCPFLIWSTVINQSCFV